MRMRIIGALFAAGLLAAGCEGGKETKLETGKPLYSQAIQGQKLSSEQELTLRGAKMHNDIGLESFAQGRYAEAVARFQQAIKLVPDYIDAMNNLGRTYYMLEQYGAAISMLNEALAAYEKTRVDRKDILASIHANLGDIYRQQQKHGEALSEYHKVMEAMPGLPRGHYELGNLYLKTGELEEAVYRFSKTLELDGNYQKALLGRALAQYSLGRAREAWNDILALEAKGLEVNPDFRKAVIAKLDDQQRATRFRPGT